MSSPAPGARPEFDPSDAEVDEVIAEFGGDVRAVVRALLHDQAALIADAEQAISRGFLRRRFSAGPDRTSNDGT